MSLVATESSKHQVGGLNEPLLLLLCLALLNAQIKPVLAWAAGQADFPNLITAACALAAIISWQRGKPNVRPSRFTTPALITAGLLLIAPMANTSWMALALCGWICVISSDGRAQRNAALVIIVAAVRTPAAQTGFELLAGPLLWIDTVVAGLFGGLFSNGITTSGNLIQTDGAHDLLVMSGCASFANVSLMLLSWFSAVRILGGEGTTTRLSVALAIAAAGVLANCIRIGLMSISEDTYVSIHGEIGSMVWTIIYAIIVLVAVNISTRAA